VYFYARCPGTLGNSLKVSVCDSAAAFSSNVDLDFTTGDAITYSTTIDSATAFNTSKATSTSKSTATTTALNTTTTFDTTTAFNTTGATVYSTSVSGQTVSTGSGVFTLVPNSNTANVVVTSSDGSAAASACVQDVLDSIVVGDYLRVAGTSQYMKVSAKGSATVINATASYATLSFENKYSGSANAVANTGNALTRYWEFYNVVDRAPGQSDFVAAYGNTSAQELRYIIRLFLKMNLSIYSMVQTLMVLQLLLLF